jgi:hypothetical protein
MHPTPSFPPQARSFVSVSRSQKTWTDGFGAAKILEGKGCRRHLAYMDHLPEGWGVLFATVGVLKAIGGLRT